MNTMCTGLLLLSSSLLFATQVVALQIGLGRLGTFTPAEASSSLFCHGSLEQQAHERLPQHLISDDAELFSSSSILSSTSVSTSKSADSIYIRSSRKEDLPSVIDLLAFEAGQSNSVSGSSGGMGVVGGGGGWNAGIQMLKRKQSLKEQLTPRLDVVLLARNIISDYETTLKLEGNRDISVEAPFEAALWDNDAFRSKVEKAANVAIDYGKEECTISMSSRCSTSMTAWDNHNFDLTPQANMLQHFVLTAVDAEFVGSLMEIDDGSAIEPEVAGFCEIGMVPMPLSLRTYNDDHEEEDCEEGTSFIPCIGNLVVSPNQRRRGIAKRLIQSAIRLVRLHGVRSNSSISGNGNKQGSMIGLWVDAENTPAISLYDKVGFVAMENNTEGGVGNEKIFMTLDLVKTTSLQQRCVDASSSNDISFVSSIVDVGVEIELSLEKDEEASFSSSFQ